MKYLIIAFFASIVSSLHSQSCDTIFRQVEYINPNSGLLIVEDKFYISQPKCLVDLNNQNLAQFAYDEIVRQSIENYSDTANFIIFENIAEFDTLIPINNGTEAIPVSITPEGLCVQATAMSCDSSGISGIPITLLNSSVTVIKEANLSDTTYVTRSDTVDFKILVCNTGQTELNDIIVTDSLVFKCNTEIEKLIPGECRAQFCRLTGIDRSFTNSVTVQAQDPNLVIVTDSDGAVVILVEEIPTMGSWGLACLSLFFLIIAIINIKDETLLAFR